MLRRACITQRQPGGTCQGGGARLAVLHAARVVWHLVRRTGPRPTSPTYCRVIGQVIIHVVGR